MAEHDVVIAGGGIAGLATALGLSRIGRCALVLERQPQFEEYGAGLQIGPNAVRALQWLGAWEAVAPHCVVPTEIQVRDGLTGRLLQRVRLGTTFEQRFGAPYRVAHRGDLHRGLLETARSQSTITLQENSEIAAVSPVETTFTLKSGPRLTGTLLVGADGVRSLVRRTLQSESGHAPLGNTLYRALIPYAQVPVTVAVDAVTLWLCPGGHIVHYPVSNWQSFNVVASVEAEDTQPSLAFESACSALGDILDAVKSWSPWPGLDVVPNPKWVEDRVVLVGDAAHATLPYLAQGAAMSLEDACCLSHHLQGQADPTPALEAYVAERFPRTRDIQTRSRAMARYYHAAGALRLARNAALRVASADRFLQQLAWIYTWQPG